MPSKAFNPVLNTAVQVWNSLYIMSLFISEFSCKNNYDFKLRVTLTWHKREQST